MTGYESKKAAARDKLAQPEQEPLIWKLKDHELGCGLIAHITAREYNDKIFRFQQCYEFIGKSTTPPAAQRTWVGLTDEDCKGMSAGDRVVAMWSDRTLKEKNNG